MKQAILVAALMAVAIPAHAQFGGIDLKKIQQAKQKYDDLNVSEEEEQKIGQDVSAKIRQRFGVVQSVPVHKYVTLVGMTLARQSERPNLPWTFVVLDTDGVNAFASPGGIVHITRGALGLIKSEAELAGVLAHEIGHVAHKHTVNAIKKNKTVSLGTSETLSNRAPFVDKIATNFCAKIPEGAIRYGLFCRAGRAFVGRHQRVGQGVEQRVDADALVAGDLLQSLEKGELVLHHATTSLIRSDRALDLAPEPLGSDPQIRTV